MRNLKNQIYVGAKGKKSLYDFTIPDDWNGKIIIFLHGYMGYKDWGCWNLVADFFTDKQFGFLKYNVSHNGGTLENPIDFDDLESFAENTYVKELLDFQSIIELVDETFDSKPIIYLIGHSRGGGVALLNSDNGRISKISTWAAISDIESRFPTGDELAAWESDGYYFRKNGRTKQTMPHKYLQYESFVENRQRLNIQTYCENSTIPTMVIHGSADTSVALKESELIAKWLNTELHIIKGEQHTFGSKQPWTDKDMPAGLLEVCNLTYGFFEDDEAADNETTEKLSLMKVLVQLAKSDNELRDAEFKFLASVAYQLGLNKHDFKRVFNENIEFQPPALELDRIIQFHRLILLMNIDLKIEKSEILFIRNIGIRMGLHPSATDEVIKIMHDYENKIVPPDVLLGVFKTFHN